MAAVERDAVINFARPLAAKGTFSRGIPDPGICGWVHGAFLFVFCGGEQSDRGGDGNVDSGDDGRPDDSMAMAGQFGSGCYHGWLR